MSGSSSDRREPRRGGRSRPFRRFAIIGVVAVALVAFLLIYYTTLPTLAVYFIAISVVAFIMTAYDKTVAGGTVTRIPENVLFTIALLGGSPGLLLGMRLLRHKTKKVSFRAVVGIILTLQAAAVFAVFYYDVQLPI